MEPGYFSSFYQLRHPTSNNRKASFASIAFINTDLTGNLEFLWQRASSCSQQPPLTSIVTYNDHHSRLHQRQDPPPSCIPRPTAQLPSTVCHSVSSIHRRPRHYYPFQSARSLRHRPTSTGRTLPTFPARHEIGIAACRLHVSSSASSSQNPTAPRWRPLALPWPHPRTLL